MCCSIATRTSTLESKCYCSTLYEEKEESPPSFSIKNLKLAAFFVKPPLCYIKCQRLSTTFHASSETSLHVNNDMVWNKKCVKYVHLTGKMSVFSAKHGAKVLRCNQYIYILAI